MLTDPLTKVFPVIFMMKYGGYILLPIGVILILISLALGYHASKARPAVTFYDESTPLVTNSAQYDTSTYQGKKRNIQYQ